VRLGDIVPADIKLVSGDYVQVDESALTGESLPVEKHAEGVAYAGSIIQLGEMTAVVYATAMNTYFGKTAKLVEVARTESHFQKAVVKIGDYLIVLAASLVVLIFMVAMFRHESLIETLQFALVLTVAAIPVALPAVLSVTMAVGAAALAKRKAIVSKLAAIEEMRSEEHTSELQSLAYNVCRLLTEKKKNTVQMTMARIAQNTNTIPNARSEEKQSGPHENHKLVVRLVLTKINAL